MRLKHHTHIHPNFIPQKFEKLNALDQESMYKRDQIYVLLIQKRQVTFYHAPDVDAAKFSGSPLDACLLFSSLEVLLRALSFADANVCIKGISS